ncbi:MAG: NADPH-dependent F420 reductase [Mesorhizobium sp.]|nr:NADPH-dependent F420 reductase [Mesorhizobium sp.]
MSYAIVGFGAIGQALARAFARKNIPVTVAARRGPEAIAPQAKAIGPTVTASSLEDALKAQTVILAIPFSEIAGLASMTNWDGRTVVDPTNAIHFPDFTPADLGGKFSSSIVQETLSGARVVKAFNTIPAAILAQSPEEDGGRRVVFLSGDDPGARKAVSALIDDLGFAPMDLGSLQDGALQQCFHPLWAKNLILKG